MLRLLIVDDDFVNRKLLAEMLRGMALCDMAGNGREALDAFEFSLRRGGGYDVILLDVAMPRMDGLDFLHRMRRMETEASPDVRRTPVIMITGNVKTFEAAFLGGCTDYLTKPVNAALLMSKIRQLLPQQGKKGEK